MSNILKAYTTELQRQDKSDSTVRNYVNDVEQFTRWMEQSYGECDLSKVVQREIIEYRGYLLNVKQSSPATVNRRLASLNSFFDWCLATNQMKRKTSPASGVKTIALVDPGPKSLDSKSLRRLLREVHVHGNSRDIAILETLLGTGIRVGELVVVTLNDIEISERKGTLRVRCGKGRSSREVPMNIDVRKALQAWLYVRPTSTSIGTSGVSSSCKL